MSKASDAIPDTVTTHDKSALTAKTIRMTSSAELLVGDLEYDESLARVTGRSTVGRPGGPTGVSPLLHARLKAATIALMLFYGFLLLTVWPGTALNWFAYFPGFVAWQIVRLVFLAGVLGLLYSRESLRN